MSDQFIEIIDAVRIENGYATRAEFIRDAIREMLRDRYGINVESAITMAPVRSGKTKTKFAAAMDAMKKAEKLKKKSDEFPAPIQGKRRAKAPAQEGTTAPIWDSKHSEDTK
jgi:Arc/MetJ-type ribon-helix-helix transcriptional regulator